jgi:hypothetical protein
MIDEITFPKKYIKKLEEKIKSRYNDDNYLTFKQTEIEVGDGTIEGGIKVIKNYIGITADNTPFPLSNNRPNESIKFIVDLMEDVWNEAREDLINKYPKFMYADMFDDTVIERFKNRKKNSVDILELLLHQILEELHGLQSTEDATLSYSSQVKEILDPSPMEG